MANNVMRTQRVVVENTTIYTTSQMITALKQKGLLIQLNQKHFPCKGESNNLIKELCYLAIRNPDAFSLDTKRWLGQRQPDVIRNNTLRSLYT